MVDNVNPTSQFHPYQPVSDVPAAERQSGGLNAILQKVGITPEKMGAMRDSLKNMNASDSLTKVREYAKAKPGLVLVGLAAVAIGAGLMRRSMR